jgi:hypothetical protein
MAPDRKPAALDETRRRSAQKERRTREILEKVDKLPVLDPRPADEMLYDKDGLPK